MNLKIQVIIESYSAISFDLLAVSYLDVWTCGCLFKMLRDIISAGYCLLV